MPFSTELSKELLELLNTMSEKEVFNGTRNGYIKTHLVASILERVGEGFEAFHLRSDELIKAQLENGSESITVKRMLGTS